MAISLRSYRGPEDLALQNSFWIHVTRDLPWCWKPTTSPTLYINGPQFDPRSRCFGFDGDRLVGYMSFTGQGDFVSLGYPWILPAYEGELQERLFDAVYGFAAGSEYGGKTFAQRFRQQWTSQLFFFKQHGFVEQRNDPIYALDLHAANASNESKAMSSSRRELPKPPLIAGRYRAEIQPEFEWVEVRKLAAKQLQEQQLAMFKSYFQTVDFDFAVKATIQGDLAVYFGFAIRQDTGFAELIAVVFDQSATDVLGPCLLAAVEELQSRNARVLGMKPIPADGASEFITQVGFRKVSEELLMFKKI